ncbi:FecCD family ABC transporter permease [Spiroplasma culicicola]|nr:iron ABC transporter permease [Spiroplasma culicicola]
MVIKKKPKKINIIFYFILFSLIFTLLFFSSLYFGRFSMKINVFFEALFNAKTKYTIERSIIINLRLPRTIAASLIGISLALSGLVYQEIFQNKLVSPDLLGVSSGASVGACFAILVGLGGIWICTFSFVFGIISMILTLFIAKVFRNDSPIILLLSGIIISGFMGAVLSLIKYLADSDSQLGEITFWLLGSFSKVIMSDVWIILPIVSICSIILLILRWRINIISLGREEATTRGLNYKIHLLVLIIVVTILTSISVAFAGVIGWVGLVIPHITRIIVGRNNVFSIPISIFLGAIFLLLCDIISRSFTNSEIPLSAITGFIGTPTFIVILALKKGNIYE